MGITPRPAVEILREVRGLNSLPLADLRALADACEVRKAARGAPLFAEGAPAEGLFVVRTGEIKVTKQGKDGREQIIYLARPGRPISEGVRFDGGKYPASAIAMRNSSALLLDNATVQRTGEQKPVLLRALLDLRAHREDRTLALVSDLSLRTVPARLASFLCALAAARGAKPGQPVTLVRDLTTETVAGRLGTVREEISRGLAFLERQSTVQVTPDAIDIVDLEKLEKIAYGPRRATQA